MTYILFNPLANGGSGTDGAAEVRDAFREEQTETLDVTSINMTAFLAECTADDKVILCGGDGTLNRFVNDLDGMVPDTPIYLWRFGTGNDFLRDVSAGDERMILLNEHIRRLPSAQIGERIIRYVNGCSCGVDALVCRLLNESRSGAPEGRGGYIRYALSAIFRQYRPMSGRVTVDGQTREYDAIWMAAAMHGRYQGGGMKFAPDQDRGGELLCSMVWHDTKPLGTLLRFPSVIAGTHTKYNQFCDMRFGREITVELDVPTTIQLDGETLDGVTGYTARK